MSFRLCLFCVKLIYIDTLENVQRLATRLLPGMNDLSYPDRFKRLNLRALAYRRVRGDMIQCYKILHGIYDPLPSPILRLHRDCVLREGVRRDDLKLYLNRANTNLRKHSFPIRVVKTWNGLPNKIVHSPNINIFKNRLDKHWFNQEIVFNYRATIFGN